MKLSQRKLYSSQPAVSSQQQASASLFGNFFSFIPLLQKPFVITSTAINIYHHKES
jgi:hypothetical protein